MVTVEAQGTADGSSRYMRALGLSPDGRTLAASIGRATGVFRAADGVSLRIAPGLLIGWSGTVGVLTQHVAPEGGGPSLFRYAFDPGDAGRVLLNMFKGDVVTEPGGKWFATPDPNGFQLHFWRPSGARLRRVWFPSQAPSPIGAVAANGRVAAPTGS